MSIKMLTHIGTTHTHASSHGSGCYQLTGHVCDSRGSKVLRRVRNRGRMSGDAILPERCDRRRFKRGQAARVFPASILRNRGRGVFASLRSLPRVQGQRSLVLEGLGRTQRVNLPTYLPTIEISGRVSSRARWRALSEMIATRTSSSPGRETTSRRFTTTPPNSSAKA